MAQSRHLDLTSFIRAPQQQQQQVRSNAAADVTDDADDAADDDGDEAKERKADYERVLERDTGATPSTMLRYVAAPDNMARFVREVTNAAAARDEATRVLWNADIAETPQRAAEKALAAVRLAAIIEQHPLDITHLVAMPAVTTPSAGDVDDYTRLLARMPQDSSVLVNAAEASATVQDVATWFAVNAAETRSAWPGAQAFANETNTVYMAHTSPCLAYQPRALRVDGCDTNGSFFATQTHFVVYVSHPGGGAVAWWAVLVLYALPPALAGSAMASWSSVNASDGIAPVLLEAPPLPLVE